MPSQGLKARPLYHVEATHEVQSHKAATFCIKVVAKQAYWLVSVDPVSAK